MATRKQFNMKFPPTLMEWVDEEAARLGLNRTSYTEKLYEAARDGRMSLRPRGPDAFPKETLQPGDTHHYPILVTE